VLKSAKVDPGRLCWKPRNTPPIHAHRIECEIQVSTEAADALFNSPKGYRAMFAQSVECGKEANRQIIQALVDTLWPASGQLPLDHVLSLTSLHAKVWMKQDSWITGAIKDETVGPPVVEIAHRPWMERLGCQTRTSRGLRWFARGGVLTSSPSRGVIDLKGAWILDGTVWPHPDKGARSEQLHLFGFS
jgi:hypothetical protein